MLQKCTSAVSRYKFFRSLESVTVQYFNCVQMSVSGCKIQQDLSCKQGFAKTTTSPLIIPSVLEVSKVKDQRFVPKQE